MFRIISSINIKKSLMKNRSSVVYVQDPKVFAIVTIIKKYIINVMEISTIHLF